jgi:IS5 family transposase
MKSKKKASKSKPPSDEQKASNRQKSMSCARDEHFFDFMTNSMKAMYVRTIGYIRAVAKIRKKGLQHFHLGIITSCRT